MEPHSKRLFMLNGALIIPNSLSPTEVALFNSLSAVEDIKIVHFMPLERFKQLIESNQLHLSRVDGYADDTREGMYPEINLVKSSCMDIQFEEAFGTRPNRQLMYKQAMIIRKITYVHCWFKGKPTSKYMWDKYGDAGKGICIQGSTNKLRLNIYFNDSEFHGRVGECVYTDPEDPIPTGVSWFPSLRKDKNRFEAEQEIRFLIRYDINQFKKGIRLNDLPRFQKLPVDLNGLIDSIYLGPNMEESERESISRAISDLGLIENLKPL